MGNPLWLFALLAVCTNTVVPVPFEPVLLFYFTKYPDSTVVLVTTGSVCAAGGGVIDLALAKALRKRILKRFHQGMMEAGFSFYPIVFLFALLPLPFSVVRASLITIHAKPVMYAAAIFSGRLLRYVIFTTTIATSRTSSGIIVVTLMIGCSWFARHYWFANRRILSGA